MINTFKLVSTSIVLTALAACDGGGGGANPMGTSGFSVAPGGFSDCTPPPGTSEEAFQIVGNYKVYAGDCVAGLTLDANQWNTLLASSDNLDQVAIAVIPYQPTLTGRMEIENEIVISNNYYSQRLTSLHYF